jgi:hypothetical protein
MKTISVSIIANDKEIIPTRTPDQLYFLYYNGRNKTTFEEVYNWTKCKARTIIIDIFDDKYSMETKSYCTIGDLKKTIGLWIDVQPDKITIENEVCLFDIGNIWEAAFQGSIEFKVKFDQNMCNTFRYEVIQFKTRKLIFKENDLKLQMMIHEDLKIRTVKKILLTKLKKFDFWIKFRLIEELFTYKSRISDLPNTTELIGMISFKIQEKFLIFNYSDNSFKLKFSNDREFEEIELDVKDQAEIGDDIEFIDTGERKIQKGEFVLEHNIIKLVKINQNMRKEECKLIELNLNVSINN